MQFDEDYAYERARQQKVDNITHLNRPQRYERVDTHKHIPFVDTVPPVPKIDWSFWIAIALIVAFVFAVPYANAQSYPIQCKPDGRGGMVCRPCPEGVWCR